MFFDATVVVSKRGEKTHTSIGAAVLEFVRDNPNCFVLLEAKHTHQHHHLLERHHPKCLVFHAPDLPTKSWWTKSIGKCLEEYGDRSITL